MSDSLEETISLPYHGTANYSFARLLQNSKEGLTGGIYSWQNMEIKIALQDTSRLTI